jgi:flagellar hook-associated protein 2
MTGSITGKLDVKSIVDAMIQSEKSKRLSTLNVAKSIQDMQNGSFDKLKTLLESFQASLKKVKTSFETVAYSVDSSNTAVATAKITQNSIAPGTHVLNVTSLAQTQTTRSNADVTSFNTALGSTDTLTITNAVDPAKSVEIELSATDTLQDVVNKINSHSDEMGVSASILTTNTGGTIKYNLVVSANQSGASNGFNITGGTVPPLAAFTNVSTAADAAFTINGVSATSPTNTIGNADGTGGVLSGLSLTLLTTGSSTIKVTASKDDQKDAVKTAVTDMISAYNDVVTFIDKTQIDKSTNNAAFTYIKNQLAKAMSDEYTSGGDVTRLLDFGIGNAMYTKQTVTVTNPYATNKEDRTYTIDMVISGTLKINDVVPTGPGSDFSLPAFSSVFDQHAQDIESFFTDPNNGLIAKIDNILNNDILKSSPDGLVTNAQNSIKMQLDNLNEQTEQQNKIIESMQQSLTDKFSMLNALLAKIDAQQAYLTQMVGNLNSGGGK